VSEQSVRKPKHTSRLARYLIPIGSMAAALSLIAVIYLGYDLAKGRISPCEAVFQESSIGLKTKISFLKTEGEIEIGREQIAELTERAQMTALNLKTCCTVLDAGRVDPEQFLQCKGNARTYEARLDDIAELVRSAVKEGISTGSVASTAALAAPTPAAEVKEKIAEEVEAAKKVSRDFNQQVVQVRKEQALETLKATPPQNVTIEAQESEPNSDMLTTNGLRLDTWVTASVGEGKDDDYFVFTTPKTHRDWIRIELQNRSTTLEPRLRLYDSKKAFLGERYNTTTGADLSYDFVGAPETTYIIRASNYYGEHTGVYLLRVTPTKAYDTFEPNDDILHAAPIQIGSDVKAGIMDGHDSDYFRIEMGDADTQLLIKVANTSTTLRPHIRLFDANKAGLGDHRNTTGGGDASYAFKAAPGTAYYVQVRDYYGDAAGTYTLSVTETQPDG